MTLRERREQAGLSQVEVSRALEVDQSSVCLWERGKNAPLKKYRRELAKLYKCGADELADSIALAKAEYEARQREKGA